MGFKYPPFEYPPTAKQLVGLGHDTPLRLLLEVPREGALTADQLVAFHATASTDPDVPTATQLVALEHAMPLRLSPAGEVTIAQVEPFHCSINVEENGENG
jgi:hypothetical protein